MSIVYHLVFIIILCCTFLRVNGVIVFLNGPIDSSRNILITDINPTDGRSSAEALFCISELMAYNNTVQQGNWYLNNNTILDDKGWEIDQRTFDGFQTVTLRRVSDTAVEGEFTCHIEGDTNPSVNVGIYYPIKSVVANIIVVSVSESIFRVQCTSTGGRALSMFVTGPHGINYTLTDSIQAVGNPQAMGDDEFTALTSVLSGGMNGDIYQCRASNGVSSDPTNDTHLELKGTTDPTQLYSITPYSDKPGTNSSSSYPDGPTSNKGFVVETKVWIIAGSIVAGIVLLVVTVTVSIPVYIKFCRNK